MCIVHSDFQDIRQYEYSIQLIACGNNESSDMTPYANEYDNMSVDKQKREAVIKSAKGKNL